MGEAAALALALCSLLLSLAALGPLPGNLISNPLAPAELLSSALIVGGGALLALGMCRDLPRSAFLAAIAGAAPPIRRVMIGAGEVFVRIDHGLRQWPVAGLSLLTLTLLLGMAMFAGR